MAFKSEELKGCSTSLPGKRVVAKGVLRKNPLVKTENIALPPHVSFYSEESMKELKRRTAENVVEVLMGKWPTSVVNRNVIGKTRAPISSDT